MLANPAAHVHAKSVDFVGFGLLVCRSAAKVGDNFHVD
jgi:hypothetical protein